MRIAAGVFYILYGIVAAFVGAFVAVATAAVSAVVGPVIHAYVSAIVGAMMGAAPTDGDAPANRLENMGFFDNWFSWFALMLLVLGILALVRRGTTAQRKIHLSAVAICLAGLLISIFHFESDIYPLAFHGLPAVLAGLVAWRLWQPVPA